MGLWTILRIFFIMIYHDWNFLGFKVQPKLRLSFTFICSFFIEFIRQRQRASKPKYK